MAIPAKKKASVILKDSNAADKMARQAEATS